MFLVLAAVAYFVVGLVAAWMAYALTIGDVYRRPGWSDVVLIVAAFVGGPLWFAFLWIIGRRKQ
jgi:hypothetical protein